jgi:biopolymer transport protein TolQ
MQTDLSFFNLFLNASLIVQLVMITLILASIFSWGIIFWKISILKNSKKELAKADLYYNSDPTVLYHDLKKKLGEKTDIENVFSSGFGSFFEHISENDSISYDKIQRLLTNSQERMYLEIETIETKLKKSISNLATIGSVSPYIGLLGTVIGIMHSFQMLSGIKQASIDMVAPGIAEALIATAIGLAAAIPAYIANNKLTEISKNHTDAYYHFADRIINNLNSVMLKKNKSKKDK